MKYSSLFLSTNNNANCKAYDCSLAFLSRFISAIKYLPLILFEKQYFYRLARSLSLLLAYYIKCGYIPFKYWKPTTRRTSRMATVLSNSIPFYPLNYTLQQIKHLFLYFPTPSVTEANYKAHKSNGYGLGADDEDSDFDESEEESEDEDEWASINHFNKTSYARREDGMNNNNTRKKLTAEVCWEGERGRWEGMPGRKSERGVY